MDRRKELKWQYKQMRPIMGIFTISSNQSNRCYLEAAADLKSTMNAAKFKLGAGLHPNRELQKEWDDQGAENFTVEILEILEYDKDESKTDYQDELELLEMVWREKMSRFDFYVK